MSESVLMYSLSNGTHVLLHHNVLGGKGTENVPLVVVEDASTVAAVEGESDVLPNMHIVNTITLKEPLETVVEQEQEEVEEVELEAEPPEENTQQDSLQAESTEFEGLHDFAEVVTWYKCRKCSHAVAQLPELVEHLKTHNIEANLKSKSTQSSLMNENPKNITSESEIPKKISSSNANGSRTDGSECLIYLCGQCTQGYDSQDECKQHMTQANLKSKSTQSSLMNKNPKNIANKSEIPKKISSSNAKGSRTDASECLVFLCGQCTQAYNSLDECKQHMMQDHDLVVQELNETATQELSNEEDIATSNEQDIEVLQQSRTEDFVEIIKKNQPQCNFACTREGCENKFASAEALNIHLKCHMPENCSNASKQNFKCHECKVMFSRWKGCAMHLWVSHRQDAGLLLCPVCKKYRSPVITRIVAHMQTHGEDRSFECPECGKGFKQAVQLRTHRVIHKNRETDELPRWYATKQCNICLKKYADSKCLKKHIQAVHSKLRPYVCHVCGHASARRAMLQMHLRQHTGEKPHACTMCPFRTGDHNSLRRHVMRHTGQRPYRCPHCPYTAIQSSPYKNHLSSKHPGQSGIFSCIHCPFRTVNQEGFVLHVSDHKNGILPITANNNTDERSSNNSKSQQS